MTPNDRAIQLLESGQILDAVAILRELAWRDPSYKSYLNLASALRNSGDFDEALLYAGKAFGMDTSLPHALLALANISTECGKFDYALSYYEGAFNRVAGGPDVPSIQQVALAYAQALLRERRFIDAWPLWELGRYTRSYSALPGTKRWLGEPCSTLLVVCEGGFGDAMLFGRWLPFAKSRAEHVKLVIWQGMVRFRDWSALGVEEVISSDVAIDPAGIDYTTSWMSLPAIAGVKSVSDIPEDVNQYARFHSRFTVAPSDHIGYCWRAEENVILRKSRTLPHSDATALAHRLQSFGSPISLAPRKAALHRTEEFQVPDGVEQDDSLLIDWSATARAICSCKLVVTVDTAVAHLAGLCGVPTLILLPAGSDWKWGTPANTEIDSWYGSHVHYFRNPDPLKWDVEGIALAAAELARERVHV